MPNKCMHCGREMELRHLNFHTGKWECRMEHSTKPGCDAGRDWYAENTHVDSHGVRRMNEDREVVNEPANLRDAGV